MSIEARLIRLACDQCHHEWVTPIARNPTEARQVATLGGWTSVGGFDRCPTCTQHRTTGVG